MSTTTMQVQQDNRIVAGDVRVEDSPYGRVVFINTDLVTDKTIAIMLTCLEDLKFEALGHGLFSVVFREDNRPKGEWVYVEPDDEDPTYEPSIWRIFPDSKAAVCNLYECIQSAIRDTQDTVKKKTECVSVYAAAWKNILQGFFHEVHHGNSFLGNKDLLDILDECTNRSEEAAAQIREDEETAAVEFARQMLFKIAKIMDCEVEFSPVVANMVDMALMAEIEAINGDADSPEEMKRWAMIQTYLRDNGGVFYDPKVPGTDTHTIYLKTFKSFMHFLSRDADNDPAWNTQTTGVVKLEAKFTPYSGSAHDVEPSVGQPDPGVVITTIQPEPGTIDAKFTAYDDDDVVPDFEYESDAVTPGFEGVTHFQPTPAVQPEVVQTPVQTAVVNPTTDKWVAPWEQAASPVAPTPPVNPTNGYNPNVVIGEHAYQPIVLPAGVNAMNVVYGLYSKIFTHIFRDCRYNPANQAMPFEMAGNIATPLVLDQHESLFVKEMTCTINNQYRTGVRAQGSISGYLMDKERKLPGYDLTMSTPEGTQIKRRFIPQNPHKVDVKTGALTATAQLARNGAGIMWIIDPDSPKGFSLRILNSVLQKNVNGQWVNA